MRSPVLAGLTRACYYAKSDWCDTKPGAGLPPGRAVYRGDVTDSPLSAGELRAAAETHKELPAEYRDAVLESFVDRVGREIDARVDARLAQAAGRIALGIPITGIVVAAGAHPTGIWGLLVVWIAIAVINVAYAARLRPPGDHH